MTLLQLLNQEYITPQRGWSFCLSHLAMQLHQGYEPEHILGIMLLLHQMGGIKTRKWRHSPLDTGYTKCLC